jgi:hypothetical protein
MMSLLCACAASQPLAPAQTPAASSPAREVAPATARVVASPTPQRCLSAPAGRLELLPSQATMVAAIDLPAVLASALYLDNRENIETGEAKAAIEAASGCNLGVTHWRRVTLGSDPLTSDLAVVLTVEGIGDAGNLGCMADALTRIQGKPPWTRVEHESLPKLAFADGRAAWVLDDCTVVVASANWIAPVEQLLAGRGTSVRGGPLEPAIARTAVTQDAWFAATLSAPGLGGNIFSGARDAAGSVELAGGLAVATTLGFADAGTAGSKATELRSQLTAMSGALVGMGFPQAVVDRVQIVAHGQLVSFGVTMDHVELATIRSKMTEKNR